MRAALALFALLLPAVAVAQAPSPSYPSPVVLIPLDVSTVTTGGTAVTALNAFHRNKGGWIQNPSGAAQAQQQQTLTPEQTLMFLVHQADDREIAATLRVTELQRQIAALQAQLAAVTKERDEAKTKAEHP